MTEYRKIPDRSHRPPPDLPPPSVSHTVPPDSQLPRKVNPALSPPLRRRDDIRRIPRIPERRKSSRRRLLAGVAGFAGLAAVGSMTAQHILSRGSPDNPPAGTKARIEEPAKPAPVSFTGEPTKQATAVHTPVVIPTPRPTFEARAVPATQIPRKIDTPTPSPRPTETAKSTVSPTETPRPPWVLPAPPEVIKQLSAGDRVKINAALGRPMDRDITAQEAAEWLRVHKLAEEIIRDGLDPRRIERINLGSGNAKKIQDYNQIPIDSLAKPSRYNFIGSVPKYPLPAIKAADGTIRLLLGDFGGTFFPDEAIAYFATLPHDQENTYVTSINGATHYSGKHGKIAVSPSERGYPTYASNVIDIQVVIALDPQTGALNESLTTLGISPLYQYHMLKVVKGESDEVILQIPPLTYADLSYDAYNSLSDQEKRKILTDLQKLMVNPSDAKPLTSTPFSEGFTYATPRGKASVWSNPRRPNILNIYQTFTK